MVEFAIFARNAAILVVMVLLLYRLFRGWHGYPHSQHLKTRFVERMTEAQNRVKQAKKDLTKRESDLTLAQKNAGADPMDSSLQASLQQAKEAVQQTKDIVAFEEDQLDQIWHPPWPLCPGDWAKICCVLLATAVLIWVVIGIMNSPPPGTTPRGLITFSITFITIGIALILFLSTIVTPDSPTQEKRFSQGKEVFTALLGVLGTIVGFYFGTSQEGHPVQSFGIESVVIDENTGSLDISVRGGKPPYFFETVPNSQDMKPVNTQSDDGSIKVVMPPNTKIRPLMIRVTDGEGRVVSKALLAP